MKKNEDGLAGIVAQFFFQYAMEAYGKEFNQGFSMHSTFMTSIDRDMKIDAFWRNSNDHMQAVDIKGSIKHKTCSIDADHPGYRDERNWFGLVFRDEHHVYLVNGPALFNDVIKHKEAYDGRFYVVSVDDLKNVPKNKVVKMKIRDGNVTFREFFKANFRGNELQGKSNEEISRYARDVID